MADLTWSQIVAAYAPADAAIAAVTDGSIYLADATSEMDRTAWGTYYQRARAHLALHMARHARGNGTQPGGAVASERLGPSSRSYALPPALDVLDSTPYGREYRRLMTAAGYSLGFQVV